MSVDIAVRVFRLPAPRFVVVFVVVVVIVVAVVVVSLAFIPITLSVLIEFLTF